MTTDGERGCDSFGLPISKQTQTHHVRVLREAGLINEIDYGIGLRRADVENSFPGLLALLEADGTDTDEHRPGRWCGRGDGGLAGVSPCAT